MCQSSLLLVAAPSIMSVHQSFLLAPGADPSCLLHVHPVQLPGLPLRLTMSYRAPSLGHPPPKCPAGSQSSLSTSPQLRAWHSKHLRSTCVTVLTSFTGHLLCAGAQPTRNGVTGCPQTALQGGGTLRSEASEARGLTDARFISELGLPHHKEPQIGRLKLFPSYFWRLEA